jgi:hypothetical protein
MLKLFKVDRFSIKGLLLINFIVLSLVGSIQASDVPERKLTTNFVNLLALGDLNLSYETIIGKKNSLIVGAHYNPDSSTSKYSHERGAHIGLRSYPEFLRQSEGQSGDYIQVTFGANKNSESERVVPSVEFWLGHSNYLGSNIFIDFSVGLGRQFRENSNMMAMFGLDLSFGF